MLISHSQCFALALGDVGRTTIIEHHIRLKPSAKLVYSPRFKRFSQPELPFIEREIHIATCGRHHTRGGWTMVRICDAYNEEKWEIPFLCVIHWSECSD